MNTISRKYINICCVLLNVLIITAVCNNLSAEEKLPGSEKNKYIFSYDMEIPTFIRYGDKVSGVLSRTGCIEFIHSEDSKSRSSIAIGYNITVYELSEPPSVGRLFSIFGLGYIPFLEFFGVPATISDYLHDREEEEKGVSNGMVSPIIGYSYSRQLLSWFRLGFSVNAGPAYCGKIVPWDSEEEFEGDPNNEWYSYEGWVEAYDAIGNTSGKWGVRLNPKIKLFFLNFSDDTVHLGLGFGYVQYVFANNHFNSYDIGLDFLIAF